MTTKMVITKQSLLAIKRRCLDKLDDDATEHERYLVGVYEFETRLRDALRAHEKMDMVFQDFADPTMDVIEAANDRLNRMLDRARDDHDRQTAWRLFDERVFDAIKDELKVDEKLYAIKELVADTKAKVAADKPADTPAPAPAPAPVAPPPPALAPAPSPPPVAVADHRVVSVELVDDSAPPADTGSVAQELEQAFARTARPDEVTTAKLGTVEAESIYARYDQEIAERWKQPPPTPPKRKKGGPHGKFTA